MSAPETLSSTYLSSSRATIARYNSSSAVSANILIACDAWLPVGVTPYQALSITYTCGSSLGWSESENRIRENGEADLSKCSTLYIFEMSEVKIYLRALFRVIILFILPVRFSPLAKISFNPVEEGSTTIRTGVEIESSL